MDTFLKIVLSVVGVFVIIMIVCSFIGFIVCSFIGFVAHRFTIAAKEVVDYYLHRKKEIITQMEEELALHGTTKGFGSH